jgi:pseudaminic acid synthase
MINYFNKPFIIAEMSGNHNHSLDRALEIVKAASDCGAHAIKLQTYTADSLTINHKGRLFDINDQNSLWNGRNLYELYQEASTPYEYHKPIFEYARSLGIIPFSTPFDEEAVDFLEELQVPFHKIASFENNHIPLLKKIGSTGKPTIMSTGLSSVLDIIEAVKILKESGCPQIVLLKCTSTYPSTPENTNLKTISILKDIFPECVIGLSDHTMGIGVSIAAIALGAKVIEKHFTLNRADGGVDSAFSIEPHEMKSLVLESERAWLSIGHIQLEVQEAEKKSVQFKRSIYVIKDIAEGEQFSKENISVIRPGDGLHPRFYEHLLGKKATQNLKRGTPFSNNFITD